jgi:hypothetical protein
MTEQRLIEQLQLVFTTAEEEVQSTAVSPYPDQLPHARRGE